MDEVVFHLNQRLENIQIWMGELLQRLSEVVEAGLASEASVRLRELLKEAATRAVEASVAAARKASEMARPAALLDSLGASLLLRPDFNRATLYAGCIGFTIGGGVGLVVGACLQSPGQPVTLMKAVAATSFQGLDAIVLLEDAVVPSVRRPDEVLIQVKAASIDPVDIKISSGYARFMRKLFNRNNPNWRGSELPVILGRDGSGIVVEVGRGVAELEPGDAVYFLSPPWLQGTLADYALLPKDYVSRKPKRITFEGAASIPYSGVMAWNAVVKLAGLTIRNAHNKRVLVHSGSKGCGWMLVQLCANLGARTVVTTAWNRWTHKLLSLGATEVVPMESDQAEKALRSKEPFDVVFNTAGPSASEFCASVAGASGKVVAAFPPDLPSDRFGPLLGALYTAWHAAATMWFGVDDSLGASGCREALSDLRKTIEGARIQPVVERVFPPEDSDRALCQARHLLAFGKTVVVFNRGPSSSSTSERIDRPDLLS